MCGVGIYKILHDFFVDNMIYERNPKWQLYHAPVDM